MTKQDLLSYLAEVGEADAIEVPLRHRRHGTLRTPRDHDLRLRNASTGRPQRVHHAVAPTSAGYKSGRAAFAILSSSGES